MGKTGIPSKDRWKNIANQQTFNSDCVYMYRNQFIISSFPVQ